MAGENIVQGAVTDVIIQPTWGTVEGNVDKPKDEENQLNFADILAQLQIYFDRKSDKTHTHDDRYYLKTDVDTLLEDLDDAKADVNHDHDGRYYLKTDVDTLLNNKLDISQWKSSNNIGYILSGTSDVTKANNNISSNIYASACTINDSENHLVTRYETEICTDGKVKSHWYLRNYNTSGGIVNSAGLQMIMDKSGTLTWSVGGAANFRSAIDAAPSSHTHSYLPLSGGTLTGDVVMAQSSATGIRQLQLRCADNDYGRIAVGGTASNSGWMEIATADDANEPIYVRQYSGAYTTVSRTLTLLDSSGNTTLPGQLNVHTGFNGYNLRLSKENLTVQSATVVRTGLDICGQTYGNTASELKSNVAGTLSYGDGGPQIRFSSGGTPGQGQNGALIFTDHDAAGTGVSFNFVSDQGDCYVNAKHFKGTLVGNATNVTGTVAIGNGGTGATTVQNARKNLLAANTNPISAVSNDTIANWNTIGTSLNFFSATGRLNNQISQYGLVLNLSYGNEIMQIWHQQSAGVTAIRSGNASGWASSWQMLYKYGQNVTISTTALTDGSSPLTTGYIYFQY